MSLSHLFYHTCFTAHIILHANLEHKVFSAASYYYTVIGCNAGCNQKYVLHHHLLKLHGAVVLISAGGHLLLIGHLLKPVFFIYSTTQPSSRVVNGP